MYTIHNFHKASCNGPLTMKQSFELIPSEIKPKLLIFNNSNKKSVEIALNVSEPFLFISFSLFFAAFLSINFSYIIIGLKIIKFKYTSIASVFYFSSVQLLFLYCCGIMIEYINHWRRTYSIIQNNLFSFKCYFFFYFTHFL